VSFFFLFFGALKTFLYIADTHAIWHKRKRAKSFLFFFLLLRERERERLAFSIRIFGYYVKSESRGYV
jgi:hypothetical protein